MPYYCTVPRCTSMAGKAKNVSFHQFPRDEELAKLWNRILKRGKPYTKYSKVCSLHFKPEDYTITSVGKNKGQWRTLRKDAIPSQNLPSESPAPYTRRSTGCWVPSQPSIADPMVQQQMAQAIYMQTMLAMQAAGASESNASSDHHQSLPEPTQPSPSSSSLTEIELLFRNTETPKEVTYKCQECTKCFKDPDVYLLHKRTHKNNTTHTEKENYTTNIQDREDTLRANPILANLLKTSMRLEPENILTVENQIMTALASNMEAYIRTLTSMIGNQSNSEDKDESDFDDGNDDLCSETRNDCEAEVSSEDRHDLDMCVAVDAKVNDTPMDVNDKINATSDETDEDRSNMSTDECIDDKCVNDNDNTNKICESQNDIVTDSKDNARDDKIDDKSRDENDTLIDENHKYESEDEINKDTNVDNVYEDRNDTHLHENHKNAINHKIETNAMYTNENTTFIDENRKCKNDDVVDENDLKEEIVKDNLDCDSIVDSVSLNY